MAEIKLPTNSITSGNAEKHEKKFEKVTTGKVVTIAIQRNRATV